MWAHDEHGARAPAHDRGRDAPEPDAREPGAPMGGERDQRRFEIVDQAPDGDLGRIAANDPRLDLDVGPELLRRPRRRRPPARSRSRRRGGGTRARARPGFRVRVPTRGRSARWHSTRPSHRCRRATGRRGAPSVRNRDRRAPQESRARARCPRPRCRTAPGRATSERAWPCRRPDRWRRRQPHGGRRAPRRCERSRCGPRRASCQFVGDLDVLEPARRHPAAPPPARCRRRIARRAFRPREAHAPRRGSRRVGPAVSWA